MTTPSPPMVRMCVTEFFVSREEFIHCYCDEGHDINCAGNMRTALLERTVRGVSVSVRVIDEKKKNLNVNKIDGFSKLHNFTYDDKGLRVWRAYDIGPGKVTNFFSHFLHISPTLYKHFLLHPDCKLSVMSLFI